MNSPNSLIPVGVIHAFEVLKDDGVFGVYRKGLPGRHWPRQLHDRPPTFAKDAGVTKGQLHVPGLRRRTMSKV